MDLVHQTNDKIESNYRLFPIICVNCKKSSDYFNLKIFAYYLDPERGNLGKGNQHSNISIDTAIEIQNQDPDLKFHVSRVCRTCNVVNYHCLFGPNRFKAMNTKISVTNKLKYLRKTWKKAHCHQQPTEIPEQAFPTDMGDHDFSSQDHGWMGPTNDLQTSQGGSVLDDQTGIDIGAELGYQSWETNDQLLKKQNYAESMAPCGSNHNAYINNAKSILGQCSFQKSFHSEKIAEVEPKSFELYLKIGELVLTLDNHSRELLSSVLQLALEEHFKSHHRDPKFLEYPTTEKQFQSEYLNPNNSNALVNKIPIPVVETLDGGGHSYTNWVTMIDYISSTTENSKKTRKAVKKRHRSLKHSKRFKDHLDKCESFMSDLERNMVVMVLFWSDGFDPNRTKTNRGSVWALTATYIFYDCTQKEVVMVKTEIVSAGRDKDDHSSVFQRMAEDLDGLQSKDNLSEPISIEAKSLFFKGQKVRCFPIIMGALMDNPERRWNCGLKMGSSNNHGYFGLSCNFSQLQVPFAACHTCKIRIEEYVKTADWSKPCLDGGQPCPRCLGFSTSKLVEDGVYREPLFQPNPLDSQMLQNASTPPGLALSRKPGFLSCKLLMEGWNFAKDRFVKAEWTAAITKSYLGDVLCINDYQIQRFLKEARQVMDPETAEEQKKYLCLPPGLWSLLELEDLYECIMHQAMNAGKALAKMMHRWTTSNGRTTTAIKAASPLLEKVKCLRLSRFRAMTYKTEKMGGYVAEDWKTWVMLGPWLYRNLTDSSMSPLRVEVPDENLPFSNMNLRHLRAWLMIRNFNFDPEAKKEELKALVKPYFISPRVLNTKSPSQWTDKQLTAWLYSRGCDEEEVEKLQEGDHNALAEEVERLMLENRPIRALETESREQCGHILQNMFLSFNSYHSSLVSGDEHGERARNRSEGKAMLFLSHSISLLTILDGESTAEAILFKKPTMYGTLRIATHFSSIFELNSLDEGGENGEGYVKKMRRYLTHGLKGNWPRHLQRKMHRGSGLHHLTWCIEQLCSGQADFQEDDPIVDRDAPIDSQEVRAYMDVDTLKEDIEDGSCLSLAVYANKQGVQHVGAIAKTSRHTCVFYKMVPSPVLTEPHGYSYFELTTDWQNPIEITDRECLAISGFHRYTAPALGLPVERTEDRVSWVYAIVIPDGRVMSEVSRGCLVFRN